MAFKRNVEKKGLSLPGLIDIIFLLLIFSLITLSVSQANIETKTQGTKEVDFDLPHTRSHLTEEANEILNTLLFEINYQNQEEQMGPKLVYALWPSQKDSVTLQEARNHALRDSLFAVFPPNILNLSNREFKNIEPNKLIRNELAKYKNEYFFIPRPTNSIEVRAVKDTEFRIINFILEECSAYGDTIPQVILRTLGGVGA